MLFIFFIFFIELNLGVGEEIDLYIFKIGFDSTIYLDNGITFTKFSQFDFTWDLENPPTNSLPICMGISGKPCPRLPEG